MRYQLIKYDHKKFDFVSLLEDIFSPCEGLNFLHEKLSEGQYKELFEVGKDSSTEFHKAFYDKYRAGWPEFQNMYEEFIKVEIAPQFAQIGENFLYQKWPTFRVHLPNNICVGRFHNDAEFGHPEGEVNFIVPMTDSDKNASVWVESEPGKKDYEHMLMRVGYMIMFSGNTLTHGSKVNDTGKTRVSMDFRCLPLSKYNEANESVSITRKTKFKIGEYYKLYQI